MQVKNAAMAIAMILRQRSVAGAMLYLSVTLITARAVTVKALAKYAAAIQRKFAVMMARVPSHVN